MKDYVVHQQVKLNATAEAVWDALTNPEKTKEYFFNARVISNWKEGSPITFKGRMFWIIPYEMKGTIVNAIPGKLLKYTLKNGKGDDATESTVTDELTVEKDHTILTITDDVGSGDGAEKRYHRSVKGWQKVLKGLKKVVEAK